MELIKGTRVRISPDSSFYSDSPNNPKDISGTFKGEVKSAFEMTWYRIHWDNGRSNNYRLRDLIIEYDLEEINEC